MLPLMLSFFNRFLFSICFKLYKSVHFLAYKCVDELRQIGLFLYKIEHVVIEAQTIDFCFFRFFVFTFHTQLWFTLLIPIITPKKADKVNIVNSSHPHSKTEQQMMMITISQSISPMIDMFYEVD